MAVSHFIITILAWSIVHDCDPVMIDLPRMLQILILLYNTWAVRSPNQIDVSQVTLEVLNRLLVRMPSNINLIEIKSKAQVISLKNNTSGISLTALTPR